MFPFLALIATGWIATIAFFATGRFRIPIVPGFLALGAIGLLELWRARKTRRSLGIGLAIVFGVAALQPLLPTYPVARADANADYLLGLRLAERGDHEGAIAIFQRALAQDPTSGEAWHGIGVSRAEQRRFEQAVEAYRQALERMPLSTWTHYNLGVCLEQIGRHQEAARAFSDAVALLPNDPNLHYRLGASLSQAGREREAIEQLEIALELDPHHSAALGLLSRIRSGE
jgi:tetratricopeptide (TPR) repeat protein